MSEDNLEPHRPLGAHPTDDEGNPSQESPATSDESPAPPPFDAPPAQEPPAHEPAAYAPPAQEPATQAPPEPSPSFAPPAPPSSPSPWTPTGATAAPSAEEDVDLREQRARRFGGQSDAADPAPGASAEPPTQAFTPDPEAPRTDGPPPFVTPLPASPSGPQMGQGPFPPTTQMPAQPAPQPAPAQDYGDFEGFQEAPASRAAAHWWTILITLVFAPVAWYLFTDGGARIEWANAQSQQIAIAAYIEFGLGLLAVFIFLLAARWSSVGSIIMGSLFLALGLAYLIFPAESGDILASSTEHFGRLGQFGINVVEHLSATFASGRMALYGLVLIMVGVVSHGARRQGRREERTKIALGG